MNGERNADAAVRSLLGAVRRRLWFERCVAALRAALWSWAAILAITAALHLAFGRPGFAAASLVAAVAGLTVLGWAALRRPGVAESALYADRRLGGESAYATWLESRADAAFTRDSPALQRLAQWTAAAAPRSRSALEALRQPWRLARPLVAAAICTVVATLVTALPVADRGTAVEATRPARETPRPTEPVSLDDDALARELAAELSAPLDSRVGSEDPGRGSMQRTRDGEGVSAAAVAGESSTDDARPPAAVGASVAAAGVGATAAPGSADAAGEATTARAPGSGHEAGASRDESAGTEGSRALQGALAVQRRDVIGPGEESARQADMGQAGIYEGDASALGAAVALSEPAAARPPAARDAVTLTPAEAAFAAAWARAERATRTQPR